MKTITLGELAATDKREWVQTEINSAIDVGFQADDKVPIIPNLHRQILTELKNGTGSLEMNSWHCGTSHCWAGWAIHLAGGLGEALAKFNEDNTPEAAYLIIAASCPHVDALPQFYTNHEEGMRVISRYAAMEGK